MKGFNKWNDYLTFKDEVIAKFRYARSDKTNQFLETVLETCKDRIITIPEDIRFWRARLGADKGIPLDDGDGNIIDYNPVSYEDQDIKAPPAEKTRGNRVNPRGIPCLYLCSHKGTAMAEVNPCLGETISIAEFRVIRDLEIVDFTKNGIKDYEKILDYDNFYLLDFLWPSPSTLQNMTKDEINQTVWLWMDRAFTEPVNTKDGNIGHVPTQIIAEYLKAQKYDGIKYKSAKGSGYNLALFDTDSAEPVAGKSELYDCISICMRFKEMGIKRLKQDGNYEYNDDSRVECIKHQV